MDEQGIFRRSPMSPLPRPHDGASTIALLRRSYPVPPEAGTPRAHHLLRRLCEAGPVHCLAAISEDRTTWNGFLARSGLDRRFASVEVHAVADVSSPRSDVLNLLSGRPPFDLRWKDPEGLRAVRASVRHLAGRVSPAVFYGYGIDTLQLVPRDLWGSCVLDCTDAQSLLLARRLRADESLGPAQRLRLAAALPSIRRYEAHAFRSAAAVVFNSSDDIAQLQARHPDAPLVCVIDGCDVDYFSPDAARGVEEEPDLLVFTGHMRYPPNADAAIHLVETILPRVWRRRPGVRALLIGPEPPERLRRLHDGERVCVTGFVDDVRPYLRRATLVVSPVRFGAGMKNKLQAALAMEKAMVASSVTCEGFADVVDGEHVRIADEPEAFAEAVCSLLEDPERRRSMALRGSALIRSRYTWQAATEALLATLRRTPPAHP